MSNIPVGGLLCIWLKAKFKSDAYCSEKPKLEIKIGRRILI
jgi:hypothetical protein